MPAAVAEYLRGRNLPPQIRLAPDARVEGLDWKSQPLLETTSGASDGHDLASVTPVLAGVAETGTLMVHSGEGHAEHAAFPAETHIAVVYADELVGTYEDAWTALRAKLGGDLSGGRAAAHGEPGDRPFSERRYRQDPANGRAWSEAAAHLLVDAKRPTH